MGWLMSVLGQKQTLGHLRLMSALPPKADIGTQPRDVRFVPKADIARNQSGFGNGTRGHYRATVDGRCCRRLAAAKPVVSATSRTPSAITSAQPGNSPVKPAH